MGLRVRTNIQSLNAQRHLGRTQHKLSSEMEKLASGHRINKAADDAAGLAISETLRGDLRSTAQARRNASDAVSLIQIAEGGLEEMHSTVIRLRELAVQSASDTIGNTEREYLHREYSQLKSEIERIALSTEFNGTRLLTGKKELSEELSENHVVPPLEVQVDKNYYIEADAHDQLNPINIIRIDLGELNATISGDGSLDLGLAGDADESRIDYKNSAQLSLSRLDKAMNQISSFRADLGALQNRFETTIRNLSNSEVNKSAAYSRIKDADYAHVTAEFTQSSILQQSGISVLTQANMMPEIALQLVQGL